MVEDYSKPWWEVFPECVTTGNVLKRNIPQEMKNRVYTYRGNQVHGDRFSYDSIKYTKAKDTLLLVCEEHGSFETTFEKHLITDNGGCQKCRYSKLSHLHRRAHAEILAKLNTEVYEYPKVLEEYKNKDSSITVVCKLHGPFKCSFHNHTRRGDGCPECSVKAVPDKVYFLHMFDSVYKIGIACDVERRVSDLKYSMTKEGVEHICSIVSRTRALPSARGVETLLHKKYPRLPDLGGKCFDGYTELRVLSPEEVLEIKEYLEGLNNASI